MDAETKDHMKKLDAKTIANMDSKKKEDASRKKI